MAKTADLKNTTTSNDSVNRKVLALLMGGNVKHENAVRKVLGLEGKENDRAWLDVKLGKTILGFDDVQKAFKELEKAGVKAAPEVANENEVSPVAQAAFWESVKTEADIAKELKGQLGVLRESAKKEQGFLSRSFNVFSNEKPLENAVKDIAAFEEYCRENHIQFSTVDKALINGERPPSITSKAWKAIWDFRFLVAAVGGAALGAAGYNAMDVPYAGQIPGLFFTGIGGMAVPFIFTNIFRAFSEKSPKEMASEAGLAVRFIGLMTIGFGISMAVVGSMSGFLPDPSTIDLGLTGGSSGGAAAENFLTRLTGAIGSLNLSQYILHGIGLGVGMGLGYAVLKQKVEDGAKKTKSGLSKLFNGFAKGGVKLGDGIKLTGKGFDNVFQQYLNVLGLPAVFMLLSATVAGGGMDTLSKFGGLYATIGVGMLAAAGTLTAAYMAYGCRLKEMKSIGKGMISAFSISSSLANMPYTKRAAKEIGVPDKIANSVIPLGANFNMFGTAFYLGAVSAAAVHMFGFEPTLGQQVAIAATVIGTAFGAPGAPASTLIFFEPIAAKIGLSQEMISKMMAMILPIDRPADMIQTSQNVGGDIAVALDTQWSQENRGWRGKLNDKFAVAVAGVTALWKRPQAIADKADGPKQVPATVTPS